MKPTDYQHSKDEFRRTMLAALFKTKKALVNYETDIFNYTFDRAYALGRQTKDAEGEETVACPKKLLHQIFACNESILQADPDHSGAKLLKRKLLTLFGAIISNGFSNLRRLNIAATLLAGILARETPCRNPVKRALELADALINQAGDNTSTPSSLRFECNEKK